MHRSGTTLLEQMLDGHPEVRALGELYDFTSAMRYATDHHCKGVIDATIVQRGRSIDLGSAGKRYLDGVEWRVEGRRYFTDKLPSNFLNIGFIAHALPQARILHMVRDPVETCFSNLRELFSEANAHSYDLAELADYYRLLQCADEALARAVSRADSGRGIREARRGTGNAVAPCDRVLRLVLCTRHARILTRGDAQSSPRAQCRCATAFRFVIGRNGLLTSVGWLQ